MEWEPAACPLLPCGPGGLSQEPGQPCRSEACPVPTAHLVCSPGAAGPLQQDGTHHWLLLYPVPALLGLPGECPGGWPGMHSASSPDLQEQKGPWYYGWAPRPSPSPTVCSQPLLSPPRASAHHADDKSAHRALWLGQQPCRSVTEPRGLADSIQHPVLERLGGGKGRCGSLRQVEKRA